MITNAVERKDAKGVTEFRKDYSDLASMQSHYNAIYLYKLVANIEKHYPDKTVPLRLLDIGCGGGVATVALYQLLKQQGYEHIVIDAMDISASQIQAANERYTETHLPIHFI